MNCRTGYVGIRLFENEQVFTRRKHLTTPFPVLDFENEHKEKLTWKRIRRWLIENAILEAQRAKESDMVELFERCKNRYLESDGRFMEEYLFDTLE